MFSHQIHFTPVTLDVRQLLSVVPGNCSPQSRPVAVTAPDGIMTVDGSHSSPSPKNNCTSSAFVTGSNYTQDDAGVPSQPDSQPRCPQPNKPGCMRNGALSHICHCFLWALVLPPGPFKGLFLSVVCCALDPHQLTAAMSCAEWLGWTIGSMCGSVYFAHVCNIVVGSSV